MVFPPKLEGYDTAVGTWDSEGIHSRIQQEETAARIRVLHQDKILGSQSPAVMLYMPVTEDDAGSAPCTCVKETAIRGDARCRTCHQTKRAPGYRRFMHETVYACSSAITGFVLTNTELDTEIKPHRVRLVEGATTGTVTTGDIPYSNTDLVNWTSDTAAYRMEATDMIGVEFSTDYGVTWAAITAINGATRPSGVGVVRFRVTLTRVSAATESPSWEITRIRHPLVARQRPEITVLRDNVSGVPKVLPGEILILRTWTVSQTGLTATAGRQTDHTADRSWTVPLDYFDTGLTRDTPECRIVDPEEEQAAHPFILHTRGINAGARYALFQFSYNETLGIFTHQAFAQRKTQRNESIGMVW